LLHLYQKYRALDSDRKKACWRAFCWLGVLGAALKLSSFKNLVAHLERRPGDALASPLDEAAQTLAAVTGWAVATAACHLPWRSSCLVQALAAQRMLMRQGIPGVLYLGAAIDAGNGRGKAIDAHAWLKCGDEFITGGFPHQAYTAITAYGWQ
jgi:hypothetical protein